MLQGKNILIQKKRRKKAISLSPGVNKSGLDDLVWCVLLDNNKPLFFSFYVP
jgi:hypothetical protein